MTELVSLFPEDCPRLLAAVQEAVAHEDSAALKRAAHSLKGCVGNFCAPAAFEAAARLERLGKGGDLFKQIGEADHAPRAMVER